MHRFECDGTLRVRFTIFLHHHLWHDDYVSVTLEDDAESYIRDHAGTLDHAALTNTGRLLWPSSTAAQVHRVWFEASKHLWVRDSVDSLASACQLVEEMREHATVFDLEEVYQGVTAMIWGLPKVVKTIIAAGREITEVEFDATCKPCLLSFLTAMLTKHNSQHKHIAP